MPAYQADLPTFAALDAQVVGISIDSYYCHIAWQKKEIGMLDYPLLSDFYPHAGVISQYGILREGPPVPGISDRSVFVVNKEGVIAFAKVYRLDEVPPNQPIFEVLRNLNGR